MCWLSVFLYVSALVFDATSKYGFKRKLCCSAIRHRLLLIQPKSMGGHCQKQSTILSLRPKQGNKGHVSGETAVRSYRRHHLTFFLHHCLTSMNGAMPFRFKKAALIDNYCDYYSDLVFCVFDSLCTVFNQLIIDLKPTNVFLGKKVEVSLFTNLFQFVDAALG